MAYNPPIGSIYHLYTTYILPSGGLYNPYHPLQEPEKSIEPIPKIVANGGLGIGIDRFLSGQSAFEFGKKQAFVEKHPLKRDHSVTNPNTALL